MKIAVPQRTVSICLSGRKQEDAMISYSYWSPNDGLTRTFAPVCDMLEKIATNTLFVLDYAATMNGWTIEAVLPKPPSPALQFVIGPENTSVMTIDPCISPIVYAFSIRYFNQITRESVSFDPQEGNEPGS